MSKIQPGGGYGFTSSGYGFSINANPPFDLDNRSPEQFEVQMKGDNVRIAKGRVVAQDVTNSPGTILHEYDVQGFAVYPTGKLTEGTDAASVYLSQGGYVEIDKFIPAEGENPATGSNAWGVYLIRNVDNLGDLGQVIMPFLAVMADGSEAETYSNPWEGGAEKAFYLIRKKQSVEIIQGQDIYYGGIVQSITAAVNRHQCQRIKIAAINWVDTYWKVTQHLIGSLYMPNNVHFAGELDYEDPDDAPNIDWPLNTAENESWSDPWADYTKNFNSGGPARTVNIPV